MVAAIGGFSNYMAASGVYSTQKITSPQEDLRELSSIASSYYSVSDTVEPLKTSTESDSRWLYRAVSNELGMPSGLNIDGMAESPAKITVNLNGANSQMPPIQNNPTQAGAPQGGTQVANSAGGAGGASGITETDESDDPMDLNGDGEVTIQEIQEYYSQSTEEAVSETAQALNLNLKNSFDETNNENQNLNSYKNKVQNFIQKSAANAYKQINQNYINSYV